MTTRPQLIPWSTSTLLKIATGTLLAGTTAVYLMQKQLQQRVRQLPHYVETFEIVSKHERLKAELGTPIQIGQVNLADRTQNYVDELDSKLRIPISGPLNGGFLNVLATRSESETFRTKRVEFEMSEGSFLIYEA